MRNLNFHLVKAQNILCFGDQGVEIHFHDYGPVVQVRGINLDMPGTAEDPASNASGKSSVQELLSIGLYGRTVKSPKKNKGNEILNVLAKKGTVELLVDDYRILRTYKRKSDGGLTSTVEAWKSPDKIWDSKTALDRTARTLQAEIEKEIAGMSHQAFCNVVIFDDSREYCFLDSDTPTKREIVENLMDLEQYRGYHQNAKDIIKDLKTKQEKQLKEYTQLLADVTSAEARITSTVSQENQWKIGKKRQIVDLEVSISAKQKKLMETDTGAQLEMWQATQEQIAAYTKEIAELEEKRGRIRGIIDKARDKVEAAREEREAIKTISTNRVREINAKNEDVQKSQKLIAKLEGLKEGATCSHCLSIINSINYAHVLEQTHSDIAKIQAWVKKESEVFLLEQEEGRKKTESISVMEEKIREAEGKVTQTDNRIGKCRSEISSLALLPRPEGTVAEQILESEIVELKKQLKTRHDELEVSPYTELISNAETEKLKKESEKDIKGAELKATEEELPYYQFWLEAFGDNGIRKFVIDGIIPALNERISYWLEILCDNLIDLKFDNQLEVTLTRKGNSAGYHNCSNGEKQRINLAVSQAFAYVMMLNSGTCPSVVFLDEVTGGGIDRAGTPCVHNMIFELAKERQVFVTTHNENLMALLQGCEAITMKKQDDITVLVS